jgi:hypothetical protein
MEWVEVAPEPDQPVRLCPPRYRSPASIRASESRCPLCGWFRPRLGPCIQWIYVHRYGTWEHR